MKKEIEQFISCIHDGEEDESMECENCGRHHSTAEYVNLNGLPPLDPLQANSPMDSVVWTKPIPFGFFEGKFIVIGCPCNETYFKRYERFVWEHKAIILDYLAKRVRDIVITHNGWDRASINSLIKVMEKIPSKDGAYKRVVKRRGEND